MMSEMVKAKSITLNGFRYIITKELDLGPNHYMIAIDEKGQNTMAFLRSYIVNGKEMVESVNDEDEIGIIIETLAKENI